MNILVKDKLIGIIKSLRPNQWYKNLLIFAAIFFSGHFFETEKMLATTIGFFALCFLSSGTYVLNDMIDFEKDRNHAKKRQRPIASGLISKQEGVLIALCSYIIGFILSYYSGMSFLSLGLSLIALNFSYIFVFREIPFADIVVLSTNFIIRTIAGATIINVTVSPWLFLETFLLALFLSTSKRKADLIMLGENAQKYKKVFQTYNVNLIDNMNIIFVTSILITYALFTFQSTAKHQQLTLMTIPIVFFIVLKYYGYSFQKEKNAIDITADPELLFIKDKQMVFAIICWALIIFLAYYFELP